MLQRMSVLQMLLLTQKVLAEVIGTFTMIFVGAGSILLAERFPQTFPVFIIPFAWGLTIVMMIFAVGHVSGAHFNPAVTLSFVVAKRIPASAVFVYWPSQFMGGLLAILFSGMLKKL
ncbi:MAG: aquaporin [Candidatus Omnitrophica bacterium]|nr:aquaporin [Candidatus Omnitrophota bacterium]